MDKFVGSHKTAASIIMVKNALLGFSSQREKNQKTSKKGVVVPHNYSEKPVCPQLCIWVGVTIPQCKLQRKETTCVCPRPRRGGRNPQRSALVQELTPESWENSGMETSGTLPQLFAFPTVKSMWCPNPWPRTERVRNVLLLPKPHFSDPRNTWEGSSVLQPLSNRAFVTPFPWRG